MTDKWITASIHLEAAAKEFLMAYAVEEFSPTAAEFYVENGMRRFKDAAKALEMLVGAVERINREGEL